MKNKRIEYLDTAKGILILLVIFGHLYKINIINFEDVSVKVPIYYNIREWIYTFHVPAFFIITGLLLNNDKLIDSSFIEFLKKKIKSLLIPYVILEIIAAIVQMFLHGSEYFNIKDALYALIILRNPTIVNWFVLALFFSELLFWCCLKTKRKWYLVLFIMYSILGTVLLNDIGYYVDFVCRILVGTSFIIIGNWMKKKYIEINKVTVIFVSVVCSLLCSYYSHNIDLYYCNIGNPIIYIIGSVSGSVLVLSISKMINISLLKYIGKNSLIILGTHQLIINAIAKLNTISLSYCSIIIAFIVIVIIEIFLIKIIDKLKLSKMLNIAVK